MEENISIGNTLKAVMQLDFVILAIQQTQEDVQFDHFFVQHDEVISRKQFVQYIREEIVGQGADVEPKPVIRRRDGGNGRVV